MYNVQLSWQILFSQLHVRSFKSFGAAVERTHTVMCVISVLNYLLSMFVLWGVRVECRICKWTLLSVDRTFVAAFAKLTLFRDVGSSVSYIAPTNWVQVNFWQFNKGPWPRSFSPWNFSALWIMRLKTNFLKPQRKHCLYLIQPDSILWSVLCVVLM